MGRLSIEFVTIESKFLNIRKSRLSGMFLACKKSIMIVVGDVMNRRRVCWNQYSVLEDLLAHRKRSNKMLKLSF